MASARSAGGPPALSKLASLTPRLLARKGGARPAMRSQAELPDSPIDDLGWNDMGPEADHVASVVAFPARQPARRPRGAALGQGGKAAFTLRLDAERHLKLRLACAVDERSAQALVTDALDRLLAEMPEIGELADEVGKRRRK
jgi:hypothetical protein